MNAPFTEISPVFAPRIPRSRTRRAWLGSVLPLMALPKLTGQEPEARFLKHFPLNSRTKFFHFHHRVDSPWIKEMGRFADAFVRVIHRQFFTADYNYPISVLVLEDPKRFEDYLRKEFQMKGKVPDFGMVYFEELNCYVTHEGCGLGTFTHNVMHPLMETNLPLHPMWATQGIPNFFEKFYGYWKGEDLVLELGFQNPWRLQRIGDSLPHLELRQIFRYEDPMGRFSGSEQRMVSTFLWRQGKFKTMLKLIEKGIAPEGYQTWFDAAMGMQLDEVTPLWKTYLTEVMADRGNFSLPNSLVLPDEAAYRQFASLHKLDRRQEQPLTPN